MVDHAVLVELQNKIVADVANAITSDWDYFVVNYEREVVNGEKRQSLLLGFFMKEGDGWKKDSIILPDECDNQLFQLSEMMADDTKGTWNSCTLEVDSRGKYRFSFSYDPPPRLNGIWNDDTHFENYVPRPL